MHRRKFLAVFATVTTGILAGCGIPGGGGEDEDSEDEDGEGEDGEGEDDMSNLNELN